MKSPRFMVLFVTVCLPLFAQNPSSNEKFKESSIEEEIYNSTDTIPSPESIPQQEMDDGSEAEMLGEDEGQRGSSSLRSDKRAAGNKKAKIGAGLFFAGTGMRVVSVPLLITGTISGEIGVAAVGAGVNFGGSVFQGVGASLACGGAITSSTVSSTNGKKALGAGQAPFFAAGVVFKCISTAGYWIPAQSGEGAIIKTVVTLAASTAASIMWTISTVKSLTYTSAQKGRSATAPTFDVYTIADANRGGIGVVYRF